MKYSKKLLFIVLSSFSFFFSCQETVKSTNEFETAADSLKVEDKKIVDIDGDNLEDFVTSGYEGRGCHTLIIDLSSQKNPIYTDYEIALGYPDEGDTASYWKERIKIKDFDKDGKDEVYAEIFTCCDGYGCWDDIPNALRKDGITSNFIIIEYENDSIEVKGIPFSISPEQYFHSKKVNWNQDLILKKENGKYGYVDKNDNWIILPELEKGLEFTNPTTGVYWKKAGIIINKKGEIVNDFGQFSASSQNRINFYGKGYDENGLLLAFNGISMFYLDTIGRIHKNKYFCDANSFSEGLAKVRKGCDEKYGYVDKHLKWVISPKFDSAMSFNNGKAEVEYQGKKWFLYKDGTLKKWTSDQ